MKGLLIISGLLSFLLFVFAVIYSYFDKKKSRLANHDGKRRVLGYHCILGILSLVFTLVHISDKLHEICLSWGYISVLLLILVNLSGFIAAVYKARHQHYTCWKISHAIFTVLFMIGVIFHVYIKMQH